MGFLADLAPILAPPIAGFLGLAAFLHWQTALLFFGCIALLCVGAIRFYEKHHRPEAFDDRLTDGRVEEARDWWVRRCKKT